MDLVLAEAYSIAGFRSSRERKRSVEFVTVLPSLPHRSEIAPHTIGRLRRAIPRKPDLWVVDKGEGRVVVKDCASKSFFYRLFCRAGLRREARAYEALGPLEGVPGWIGRIDRNAIALEMVDAEPLAFAPRRFSEGVSLVRQLDVLLEGFEAAGVYNLDINGRRNLMAGPDGRLIVLDLGGAVVLPPGSVRHRLFGRLLENAHRGAYLKWKELWAPGTLTAEEAAQRGRLGRLRRRWFLSKPGGTWRGPR